MLGHGHSFPRILSWHLGTWLFWAIVSPLVVREGAAFAAHTPRRSAAGWRLLALAAALLGVHSVVAAQMTIWIQPFIPVVRYDFATAFSSQLPALFAADALTFGMIAVAGGALQTRQRAQALELRESRLEAELARAELHALRLEIEPHFLFNTLNAITALVRLKDDRRAVDMLVGLGEFMRGNLDRPIEQLAPLGSELAWIRQYVDLQQTRFGDRLRVDFHTAPGLDAVPIPTFLLLPIVENAFRHGLARPARGGHLVIRSDSDGTQLALTVSDDGAGLPADFALGEQAGTGLRNVRARLEHLYGSAATLTIHSPATGGTSVTIVIPAEMAVTQERATA